MSKTRKASSVSMDSKLTRKSIRKVNIHESDDEQENYNVGCDDYYAEKQRKNKHFDENCDEVFSRRRLTSISVHSVTENDVKKGFRIACLICQRKIVCPSSRSSSFLAYYICDECMENEKEQTRILEAALKENKEKLRSVSVGCASISPPRCDCKNCVRREAMEKERLQEVELLRSYWNDLKKNIRLMFRNGLSADMCSLKGKKYDIERLKRHVEILTEKDAPQLYRRLESIGYEHVMNLKSDDLWQILVAPQVVPALIKLYESGADNEKMELERAKLFIESLLKSFMKHQETVQNMSSLLAPLDEKYFKQFGISWKVVNHRIFDRVIYQDELLTNYLPKMEKVLKCDLIVPEESEEENLIRAKAEVTRTDIPSGALELARRFRFLHKLMMTSREIFKKADAGLILLAEQQDILHQLSRQAKQELFEESLGFYEAQRKIKRSSAPRKRHFYRWHPDFCVSGEIEGPFFDNTDNSDSDSDAVNFTRRIYELIEEGPPASVCVDHNGDVIPCIKCRECAIRHCSCEECRIAHIITCGILEQDSETTQNLVWRKRLSEPGVSDEISISGKSRKRRASSEKLEYFEVQDGSQVHAAKALISFHDCYDRRDTAWGDWQVPYHYYHDFEDVGRCLNEKGRAGYNGSHGKRTSRSESACFEDENFICSKEFAAAVKAVAKQMGCNLKGDFADRQALERSPERSSLQSAAKRSEENDRQRFSISECEDQKAPSAVAERAKGSEKIVLKRSRCSKKHSSSNQRSIDSCEACSTSSDRSSSSDGDWTHVQLDGQLLDRESWENLRDKIFADSGRFVLTKNRQPTLMENDRNFLEEVASGKFTLLSATDIVSEIELNDTRTKTQEGPRDLSLEKNNLQKFPSKCNKATTELCKQNGASKIAVMRKSVDEKAAKQQEENKKLRIMDAVKDFFAKSSDSEKERANLRAVVWATQHPKIPGPITVSRAKISSSKKKVIENGVKASAFASGKQDIEEKPDSGPPKLMPLMEKKVKMSVGSCSASGKKVGGPFHGRSVASLLSASVDLHRDKMDEKEKSQLEKLIAQAAGARLDKMASVARSMESQCAELRHRCCDPKADFFCCHSECENEDYSEDAEEDSDEEWSDCEEHKHPDRHHSCDNKKQFDRTPSSSRREGRHGHCDCCYCEMFGHTALETTRAGRVPQIRERLRQKLQRRNGQEEKSEEHKTSLSQENGVANLKNGAACGNISNSEARAPVGFDAPIEVILDYINEKDNAAAQAAANKAAKRARQKLRKQEEKEKLEMERKKKEELRKAKQAEALQKKKEQQAAQQAANREKALKAEEKRKKAAEERAREQKRQKELREQERHNKRQERSQKEISTKEATKKIGAEVPKKGAKKQNSENRLPTKQKDPKAVKSEQMEQAKDIKTMVPDHGSSQVGSKNRNNSETRTLTTSFQETSVAVKKSPSAAPLMAKVVAEKSENQPVKAASVALETRPSVPMPKSHRQSEICRPCPEMETSRSSTRNGKKANENDHILESSKVLLSADMNKGKTSFFKMDEASMCRRNDILSSSVQSYETSLSSLSASFNEQIKHFENPHKVFEPQAVLSNGDIRQIGFDGSLTYTETPSSSNSSASSSLSSASTQQSFYEMYPYFHAWAPNNYDVNGASYGIEVYPMLLGLPPTGYCSPYFAPYHDPPSYSGSPFLDSTNAFSSPSGFAPLQHELLVNGKASSQLPELNSEENAPPGSSHFTAAVIAKRNETRKAFLSAAPNPLTNYDLETKQLAAEAGPSSLFPHLDPVIFTPGDPRISSAIASMNFDPHETFKPRPDSELEFLDPLELEIEHFKRLMWESKGDRVQPHEPPKVEIENDANAVFHFAPLV